MTPSVFPAARSVKVLGNPNGLEHDVPAGWSLGSVSGLQVMAGWCVWDLHAAFVMVLVHFQEQTGAMVLDFYRSLN